MTSRTLRGVSLTLMLAVGLAACGSDDSSGGAAGGSGGIAQTGGTSAGGTAAGGAATGGAGGAIDAGSDGPVDFGPYPAGPYGNAVGDTLANLAWEGYVNLDAAASSDTLPYIDYSSDDMRKSGKSYGLIHIALQG